MWWGNIEGSGVGGVVAGHCREQDFLPGARGTMAGFVAAWSQVVVWRIDWRGVTHF